MKKVGGILLYGSPLSLSIITPHIKPNSQVSLKSGFHCKPMAHEASQAAGKRRERNITSFTAFFLKAGNILQSSSFPFMNSCKMLLLDGIPEGSFGRHPHYQVWGSQRSPVVALRQIEYLLYARGRTQRCGDPEE